MALAVLTNLAHTAYVLHSYKDFWVQPKIKCLHLLDEVMILVATISNFIFSAFVDDIEARSKVSITLVVIIMIVTVANLVTFAHSICHASKLQCKRC